MIVNEEDEETVAEMRGVIDAQGALIDRVKGVSTSELLANMISMQADLTLNVNSIDDLESGLFPDDEVVTVAKELLASQRATLKVLKVEIDRRFPWPIVEKPLVVRMGG